MSFESNAAPSGDLMVPSNRSNALANSDNLVGLLRASLQLLRARIGWLILIAALIFIGVLAAAYGRAQKYESSAKLLVQLDVQTVALSPADVRYNVAAKMLDEAVGTQVELLRSRDLIERVIDQVGEQVLATPPKSGWVGALLNAVKALQNSVSSGLETLGLTEPQSPRQQLANTISDGLKILPARKSQLIDISLRLKNRAASARILNALIEQHLKKLAELENTAQAYETYSAQAQQMKGDLERAEATIAAFKLQHRFVNLASEKASSLQNAERMQALLDGIDSGRFNESPDADAQTSENPPTQDGEAAVGGNDLARLVARVNELRLEKVKRAAQYVPGHARLDEINSQLSAAQKLLKRKVGAVRAALVAYQTRSRLLDRLQPQFNQLTRNASVLEDNYKAYLKSSEDRRLASAKNRRIWLSVIDAPDVPEAPVAPTRLMLVLGGLIGSVLLAIVAVLSGNWWQVRARTAL